MQPRQPPAPQFHIDGIGREFATQETTLEQWWGGGVRIDGAYLNKERQKHPQPVRAGVRPGELGGHWLYPFNSVEWISAKEFAVEGDRARFEIKWIGPGEYKLVELTRKW